MFTSAVLIDPVAPVIADLVPYVVVVGVDVALTAAVCSGVIFKYLYAKLEVMRFHLYIPTNGLLFEGSYRCSIFNCLI